MDIIIGKQYGKLEVLKDLGNTPSRHRKYECICHECGRIVPVTKERLCKDNPVCYSCEKSKNLKGRRMNEFKVVQKLYKLDKDNRRLWLCECVNCGSKIELNSKMILRGKMRRHCHCETIRNNLNKDFVKQMEGL